MSASGPQMMQPTIRPAMKIAVDVEARRDRSQIRSH